MRRRPRGLTPGERALWEAHARRYRPRAAPAPPRPSPPPPEARAEPPRAPEPAPPAPLAPFRIGERARAMGGTADGMAGRVPPALGSPPASLPPLDRKARRALARGRMEPEARLDLHGMTLDRAHAALAGFMSRAQADGLRLVLVITGKGRNGGSGPAPGSAGDGDGAWDVIPRRRGVLRHQVPDWLSQPPLSAMIGRVASAHRRHGGDGAYYVHLRRRR